MINSCAIMHCWCKYLKMRSACTAIIMSFHHISVDELDKPRLELKGTLIPALTESKTAHSSSRLLCKGSPSSRKFDEGLLLDWQVMTTQCCDFQSLFTWAFRSQQIPNIHTDLPFPPTCHLTSTPQLFCDVWQDILGIRTNGKTWIQPA